MEALLHTVCYGLRQWRRQPGFTSVALITVALCLGANLTIFAVVDSILLRPLPFPKADRLVVLYNSYPKAGKDRDQAVAQRTHEIGVRMALGSRRSDVIWLIVGSGLRMALAGLGIGLGGALALGRLMRSTLYGVEAADLASLATVSVLLLAVALVACWVPARHSAAVNPMQALRNE
jgi:hypothetical protein